MDFAERLICFKIVRNSIFEKAFSHPNDLGFNPLRISEITGFVEVADNAVFGSKSAGRNSLIVAIMSYLDFYFVEIINILAAKINNKLILI
ncbi:hypothetical protein D3C78_1479060 [compost metagenome]